MNYNVYTTRLTKELSFNDVAYGTGVVYTAPAGLSYFWNFGSLALISLFVQIFSVFF